MNQSQLVTRASLILRLQNRTDVAAWDEFVSLYSPMLYRIARGRGFQAADAENLLQEVFLAVSESVSSWLQRIDRGPFRAWLLKIARTKSVDLLTLRATRKLGWDGHEAEKHLGTLSAPSDIAEQIDLEFQRSIFYRAATTVRDSVEKHTWDAFWLTSVEGLTIEQAAAQLQTRPGNIYFSRSRVMSRIKQIVQQYLDQQ